MVTPPVAEAGHNTNIAYDSQTVMHLDVTNTTAGSSRISSNISGTAAFVALNNYPVGISRPDGALGRTMYTTSNCAGVAGTCEAASGGNGVMGAAKGSNGCGVYGFAGSVVPSTIAPGGTGVYGSHSSGVAGYGVYGISNVGVGVRGDSTSNAGVTGQSSSNNGVYGIATGSGGGVYGQANGSGTGITGTSTTGIGVVGISPNNNAVFGDSSVAGNGVFARTVNGNGLVAQATGAGNAATFFGNVIINGNFTVAGGAKSGAVPFPDGTMRRLYSTEAPESWFEDYGEAKVADGKASVPIPSDFANAVNLKAAYHVFVTPHTVDVGALAVTLREPIASRSRPARKARTARSASGSWRSERTSPAHASRSSRSPRRRSPGIS